MSNATFLKDDDFEWMLASAEKWVPELIEAALRAGANILAGEMKKNLRGEIADRQAVQLVGSFGITPVGQDRARNWNVHLGFDGYQRPGTGEWKTTGIPFQMIARVFESGSVKNGYRWRRATHFARDAVQSKRQAAEAEMKRVAEAVMEKAAASGKGQD